MALAIVQHRSAGSKDIKQRVSELPPLNYSLKRPAFRGSAFAAIPIELPSVPWPSLFDPPLAPYIPGTWPESARLIWEKWSDAWDACAEGLELETAAVLFACYDAMSRAGFVFDPRFSAHFDQWREHAASVHEIDNEDSYDIERDFADEDSDSR